MSYRVAVSGEKNDANALLRRQTLQMQRERTKNQFLRFRGKKENATRTKIALKFPFNALSDLKEVSADAFAAAAGWTIPKNKQDRDEWLDQLKRDDGDRTIEDVELLLYFALKDVLSVFDTAVPPDPNFETRLPGFWTQVYPFVRQIREEISYRNGLREEWDHWWSCVSACRMHGTVLASDFDGTQLAWQSARQAVESMFSAIFRELHPMRIECRLVFEEIEDMMRMEEVKQPLTGTFVSFDTLAPAPVRQFVFSSEVRAIVQKRLATLEEIGDMEQPEETDLNLVECVLQSLGEELSKSAATDKDAAGEHVRFALSIFRDMRSRVYPLKAFSLPDVGKVDHASIVPSSMLERHKRGIGSPTDDSTLPTESVPPKLTGIELASFKQFFFLWEDVRPFDNMTDLDTCVQSITGEVVWTGKGSPKDRFASYLNSWQRAEPETVFKICEGLLEWDRKWLSMKMGIYRPYGRNDDPDRDVLEQKQREQLQEILNTAKRRAKAETDKRAKLIGKLRPVVPWDKPAPAPATATPPAPAPATPAPAPATPTPAPATPPAPAPATATPSVVPGSSRDNPLFISVVQSAPIDVHTTNKKPPTKADADDYEVTQEEAASDLGKSVRTLRNWEDGTTPAQFGYTKDKRKTRAGWLVFMGHVQRDVSDGERMKDGATALGVNLGNKRRNSTGGTSYVFGKPDNSPEDELD